MELKKIRYGLCVLECNETLLIAKPIFFNCSLVQTVKQNKEKYSPMQIEKADGARKLCAKAGRSSAKFLEKHWTTI